MIGLERVTLLKEGRFRSDVMKNFFTLRVVIYWNRLSRLVLDVQSLQVVRARLNEPRGPVEGDPASDRGVRTR